MLRIRAAIPQAGPRGLVYNTMKRKAWSIVAAVAACVVAVLAYRTTLSARTQQYPLPPVASLVLPTDEKALARGTYLSKAVAVCTLCHGDNLGGKLAFDHPMLGKGYTPNLTSGSGGIARTYRTEDWVRAIKHGLTPSGRGLMFMPADHYQHLRDDDLAAMIAYYKSAPPVDNTQTALQLSFVARLAIDLGLSGEVVRAPVVARTRAASGNPHASEGAYLVAVGGCTFCHGEDLRGGQGLEPGAPPGPSITGLAAKGWRYEQFDAVMRRGVLPSGQSIDPKFMPWAGYRHMTQDDMQLLWQHLQAFHPQPVPPAR
jgi:cytochrome c553